MGRDKALVPLAGKLLIEHAVTKLLRICADVRILSNDPVLGAFAPILPDIHPNCGPIGGIEAALAHTSRDWNLFMAVDMPLVPIALLWPWVLHVAGPPGSDPSHRPPGIHLYTIDGRPQPGLCIIHRDVAPLISRAIQREEFALTVVFEEIAREMPFGSGSLLLPDLNMETEADAARYGLFHPTEAQMQARHLWFLNLNTREELALAEANRAALDT
jgi:molybdopterin-guanine dinucleotide biosynthesis protein A